jgi:hypothetical protein
LKAADGWLAPIIATMSDCVIGQDLGRVDQALSTFATE